ncbi:MAG: hypothetical protein HY319_19035 [Armatimonadetes bacterium]|nr:hypothetical protein [Armatimonadota bacterium]
MRKLLLVGFLLALLLPLQVLAEEGTTTGERMMTVQSIRAPYVIDSEVPLNLSGKVFSVDNGLLHLDTDAGAHLVLPISLGVQVNGVLTSASMVKAGDVVTVEIPLDHARVMQVGGDMPFDEHFKNERVFMLGTYPGVIWMPESLLSSADLDRMMVFTNDGEFELSVVER